MALGGFAGAGLGDVVADVFRRHCAAAAEAACEIPADRVLGGGDFGLRGVGDGRAERLVAVAGVVSDDVYLVPEGFVFPGAVDLVPAGMAAAPSTGDAVARAVADLLAADLLTRWWESADRADQAADVTRLLPGAVSGRLLEKVAGDGLEASALLLERDGFFVAVVVLHTGRGGAATLGQAAGGAAAGALEEALLRAVAAQRTSPSDLPVPERVRHLAVWHCGAEYLAEMRRRSRPVERVPESGGSPDWADLACRRFGHEPLAATGALPDGRVAARVICPGAAAAASPLSAPNPFSYKIISFTD